MHTRVHDKPAPNEYRNLTVDLGHATEQLPASDYRINAIIVEVTKQWDRRRGVWRGGAY